MPEYSVGYNLRGTYSRLENGLNEGDVFVITDSSWRHTNGRIFAFRFAIGIHVSRTEIVLDEIVRRNKQSILAIDSTTNPDGKCFSIKKFFSIPKPYLINCGRVADYHDYSSLSDGLSSTTYRSFEAMREGSTYAAVLQQLTLLREKMGDEKFKELSVFPAHMLESMPACPVMRQMPPELRQQAEQTVHETRQIPTEREPTIQIPTFMPGRGYTVQPQPKKEVTITKPGQVVCDSIRASLPKELNGKTLSDTQHEALSDIVTRFKTLELD